MLLKSSTLNWSSPKPDEKTSTSMAPINSKIAFTFAHAFCVAFGASHPYCHYEALNLGRIAKLAEKYSQLKRIEVMAYHDLGRDKGFCWMPEYPPNGIATADKATQQGC